MTGEAFGNFQIVATLGKGGMGEVLLAQHQRIARRAAIKVLSPELTKDPDAVQRFFTEARATSLIHHPGIVDVYDCDTDAKGRSFIVMEYLQGETLGARLARCQRLTWPIACEISRQIADAVGAAHHRGIIHRDLKPENIFLVDPDPKAMGTSSEPFVKVLDFGVAKLVSHEARADGWVQSLTRDGMLLGTPRYISPEQCRGAARVDHRTDVYALGCILFEMLAGEPIFPYDRLDMLLAAHLFRPPTPIADLVPDVPEWLGDLLARMLAKQPEARPSTMKDVALALTGAGRTHIGAGGSRSWAEGSPSMTLILPPLAAGLRNSAAARWWALVRALRSRWRALVRAARSRPVPAAAIGIGVALVVVVGIAALTRGSGADDRETASEPVSAQKVPDRRALAAPPQPITQPPATLAPSIAPPAPPISATAPPPETTPAPSPSAPQVVEPATPAAPAALDSPPSARRHAAAPSSTTPPRAERAPVKPPKKASHRDDGIVDL